MPGITGNVRNRLIQAGRSKALILFSDTDQFVKETLDDLAQEGSPDSTSSASRLVSLLGDSGIICPNPWV
ncbi:hypothetical protein WJX75_009247 [Coccomyxa subellipsoidea]|uniref:Uncharacterized protein n=1 Tax=Coccomyxa subellipsoidea TaxID=248742 RepID=A0ABR2YU91_9CHLO